MNYSEFITAKALTAPAVGFDPTLPVNPMLYGFQSDIVKWALRRGRAAIWADCGLGKTPMQTEWARHVVDKTGGKVLILAPLAVSQQTVREGAKFGVPISYARDRSEMTSAITITNYERLDAFDPADFAGIVLDESSILKAFSGKIRTQIIESFKETPYRLACTATPAPNDFMELGNHAEFLGAMTRSEMLSMFFVHDGGSTQDWRVKGHAVDAFWRWICSWAVMLRKPSDLGYDDGAFTLPPLTIHEHVVGVDHQAAHASGMLFKMEAVTLDEQRAARRGTIDARVAKCIDLIEREPGEPWIVWCDLNAEGDALARALDGAVQVAGADEFDVKTDRLLGFSDGRHRIMVTKPKCAGFGMNWQHCARVAYVGLSNSYEAIYQTMRRCWRFGQTRPVEVHMIIAETEGRVRANIERKEKDAAKMGDAMAAHMRDIQKVNVRGTARNVTPYEPGMPMRLPVWLKTESEAA